MNNMNQLQQQFSGKVIDLTTSQAKSSKPSIPQYFLMGLFGMDHGI